MFKMLSGWGLPGASQIIIITKAIHVFCPLDMQLRLRADDRNNIASVWVYECAHGAQIDGITEASALAHDEVHDNCREFVRGELTARQSLLAVALPHFSERKL